MLDAILINSLMSLFFLIALAFWADRYERESGLLLVRVFFLSVLATGGFALIKCLGLGWCRPDVAPRWVEAYVIAAGLEELLKFALLAKLWPQLRELDEPLDAVVYLGVIALGFAFHENIGYFLGFTAEGQRVAEATGDLDLYRAQLGFIFLARAVPGHLLFDTCAGSLLAYGLYRGNPTRWLAPAYGLAVLLHGTWNLLAATGLFPLFALVLISGSICVVFWSLRRSPHRERQNALQVDLRRVAGLDPQLPRRLVRVMRRASGERQRDLDARVRGHLTAPSAVAAVEIDALIAEETLRNGRAMQFWEFVVGILLAGFLAEFLIALVVMLLVRDPVA